MHFDWRVEVSVTEKIPDELKIKTHYESLDIAGGNRIHYLCFSLPEEFPGKEKDEELKLLLKEHEGVDWKYRLLHQ